MVDLFDEHQNNYNEKGYYLTVINPLIENHKYSPLYKHNNQYYRHHLVGKGLTIVPIISGSVHSNSRNHFVN